MCPDLRCHPSGGTWGTSRITAHLQNIKINFPKQKDTLEDGFYGTVPYCVPGLLRLHLQIIRSFPIWSWQPYPTQPSLVAMGGPGNRRPHCVFTAHVLLPLLITSIFFHCISGLFTSTLIVLINKWEIQQRNIKIKTRGSKKHVENGVGMMHYKKRARESPSL